MMIGRSVLAVLVAGIIGFLALCWAGGPSTAQSDSEWGAPSEGLQLRTELQTADTPPVVPVVVRCTLRNVSTQTLYVWVAYAEVYYDLVVTDESGRIIPAIAPPVVDVWGNTRMPLAPGEELVEEYHLNKRYLLTDAGDYTISARRRVIRLSGEGFAKAESGPVVLTLSDDASADAPSRVGEWGSVTEGFQVMIEVSPAVVPSRAPVLVTVATRNVSSGSLILRASGSIFDYRITIEDESGTRVPTQRHRLPAAEQVEHELQPGEELVHQLDLNRRYDLTVPGEYTIVVERTVPRQDGEGGRARVTSNPVVLVVTGPHPSED